VIAKECCDMVSDALVEWGIEGDDVMRLCGNVALVRAAFVSIASRPRSAWLMTELKNSIVGLLRVYSVVYKL
jgi:hypothetical protein